jgi:hypothetical protein
MIGLLLFILMVLSLPLSAVAGELQLGAKNAEETIYIVNEYRYVPAGPTDDTEVGLSLCGTRCNALSTNYLNITEPGGWLMMKGASNKELIVEIKSPFIGGHCVCLVDEYRVTRDERYDRVDRERPRSQDGSEAGRQ